MQSRGPYRPHSTPFKLQLCQDIRNGVIGRRDAQRTYGVSANLEDCGRKVVVRQSSDLHPQPVGRDMLLPRDVAQEFSGRDGRARAPDRRCNLND